MLKYAVIGDPIAHSLSPVMQNAGFKALGMDAVYEAVHVKEAEIADFVKKAKKELSGFNITVPHKKNIIPFLDEITEEARIAESVNTVTIKNGKLYGTSTDGYGLATALQENFDVLPVKNRFCFIGCGGAAQATACYFAMKGAASIYLINRTLSKAGELAKRIGGQYKNVNIDYAAIDDNDKIKMLLDDSDAAIQCTSLGLKESDPMPITPQLLNDSCCLFETIYKNTQLLKYARSRGIRFADGRDMLLHQGAKAFSLWTGAAAPVEAMRNALYAAIKERNAKA